MKLKSGQKQVTKEKTLLHFKVNLDLMYQTHLKMDNSENVYKKVQYYSPITVHNQLKQGKIFHVTIIIICVKSKNP